MLAQRRKSWPLLPKEYTCTREWSWGLGWWRGSQRDGGSAGQGCAELRTNPLQVPTWNIVTSMLKPPCLRICVPNWAPELLLKGNDQHGSLTKPIPNAYLIWGGSASTSLHFLALHSFLFPSPCQHWYCRLAVALELEIPGGCRVCSLNTNRSGAFPSNPSCS